MRGKKGENELLDKAYSPPMCKAITVESTSTDSDQNNIGLPTVEDVPTTIKTLQDIMSTKYDSPTKNTLIEHIHHGQGILISQLHENYQEQLSQVNSKYTDVVNKYLKTKKDNKCVKNEKKILESEIKAIEKEEIELRKLLIEKDKIINEYKPSKVSRQLQSKENKIGSL